MHRFQTASDDFVDFNLEFNVDFHLENRYR